MLAVVLALSLVLVACGGSSEEDTGESPSEALATTQATVAPTPETPTATQVAADAVEEATATPEATPAAATTPEAAADDADSAESDGGADIVEHLRQRTMNLWEVYNTYDVDGLKVFYEENYWSEQEEILRLNMKSFESRDAKITAEETSAPTEIEPGKWETRHSASFSFGSVKMVFIYEQFDGEWLLTYAEAQ